MVVYPQKHAQIAGKVDILKKISGDAPLPHPPRRYTPCSGLRPSIVCRYIKHPYFFHHNITRTGKPEGFEHILHAQTFKKEAQYRLCLHRNRLICS